MRDAFTLLTTSLLLVSSTAVTLAGMPREIPPGPQLVILSQQIEELEESPKTAVAPVSNQKEVAASLPEKEESPRVMFPAARRFFQRWRDSTVPPSQMVLAPQPQESASEESGEIAPVSGNELPILPTPKLIFPPSDHEHAPNSAPPQSQISEPIPDQGTSELQKTYPATIFEETPACDSTKDNSKLRVAPRSQRTWKRLRWLHFGK